MKKKTPKRTSFKRRTKPSAESVAKLKQTIAAQAREIRESAEQQAATSQVLRVIASSPTELQPVLDTLIANAVRLSGATRGHVRQYDGEFHRVVAHYGETAEMIATLRANPLPASPELPAARALLGGKPIQFFPPGVICSRSSMTFSIFQRSKPGAWNWK